MDEKHNIIGLITYHAAYNYGSVLQAYATQSTITDMGHDVTVIDYRPLEGERYYERLYWRGLGLKSSLADLTMLPVAGLRKKRMRNFERFISTNIHVGQRRYQEPEELNSLADAFDVAVSGSDQIINKHSNELERVDWKYMDPYLLKWANCRKISYASSPATMTDDELRRIGPALVEFSALSARGTFRMRQTAAGKRQICGTRMRSDAVAQRGRMGGTHTVA